jgi:hypothetical protein
MLDFLSSHRRGKTVPRSRQSGGGDRRNEDTEERRAAKRLEES